MIEAINEHTAVEQTWGLVDVIFPTVLTLVMFLVFVIVLPPEPNPKLKLLGYAIGTYLPLFLWPMIVSHWKGNGPVIDFGLTWCSWDFCSGFLSIMLSWTIFFVALFIIDSWDLSFEIFILDQFEKSALGFFFGGDSHSSSSNMVLFWFCLHNAWKVGTIVSLSSNCDFRMCRFLCDFASLFDLVVVWSWSCACNVSLSHQIIDTLFFNLNVFHFDPFHFVLLGLGGICG